MLHENFNHETIIIIIVVQESPEGWFILSKFL
jgi:hypothetical protein